VLRAGKLRPKTNTAMFLNVLVFSVLSATTAHLSEEDACPKYKTDLCLLINSVAKWLAAARWSAGPVARLWIAAVLASALVELIAMAVEPAAAQSAAPVAKFETEPFSGSELINGKWTTEDQCASLPGAVWVVVDRQGDCIRYYHATAAGRGMEAVVFISSDLVAVNGRGEAKPFDYYLAQTPAGLQNGSANWSRTLNLPYVQLARPGTHGSSGEHSKRRTPREIDLVSAALDAIKSRHGYTRVHVVGYGEGALIAAALLAKRSDLGCVVLASGLLSVRSHLAERGETTDILGNKNPLDPITLVDRIAKRPELRIFIVTDPDDIVISARSQTLFAKRLLAAGLPARQVFVDAPDVNAHGLFLVGHRIAASCAKGVAEDVIINTYENKLPAPDNDDPPLHPSDVMTRGVNITEAQCKNLATALWVRVEGRAFCVRYWHSATGGSKDEAQVFLHGDLGDPKKGRGILSSADARATAGGIQREARAWSRLIGTRPTSPLVGWAPTDRPATIFVADARCSKPASSWLRWMP
jgi:pimeloyl-ACP methyl ester carboxylesterase